MANFDEMTHALLDCDFDRATALVNSALKEKVPAPDILNKGLLPGMDIVGEKMENEDIFIPEVLTTASVMSQCVEILKPYLGDEDSGDSKKVLIGTVQGDLHDIGKNLVSMMLESAGMQIHDLGVDVPPEAFVKGIREIDPDIVGISALLTTTMPMMKETVDAIVEAGVRDQVKIMVGGAPITPEFAEEIGADCFAASANEASKMAKAL